MAEQAPPLVAPVRASFNPEAFAVDDNEETFNSDAAPLPPQEPVSSTHVEYVGQSGERIFEVEGKSNGDGTYSVFLSPEVLSQADAIVLKTEENTVQIPSAAFEQYVKLEIPLPTPLDMSTSTDNVIQLPGPAIPTPVEGTAGAGGQVMGNEPGYGLANAEVVAARSGEEEVTPAPAKRKRRTKAEMAADEAAKMMGTVTTPTLVQAPLSAPAPAAEPAPVPAITVDVMSPTPTLTPEQEAAAFVAQLQAMRDSGQEPNFAAPPPFSPVGPVIPLPPAIPQPQPIAPPTAEITVAPITPVPHPSAPPSSLNLAIQWNESDEFMKRIQAHALLLETARQKQNDGEAEKKAEDAKIQAMLDILIKTMQVKMPTVTIGDLGRVILSSRDENGTILNYKKMSRTTKTITAEALLLAGVSSDVIQRATSSSTSYYWQVDRTKESTLLEQGVLQAPSLLEEQG